MLFDDVVDVSLLLLLLPPLELVLPERLALLLLSAASRDFTDFPAFLATGGGGGGGDIAPPSSSEELSTSEEAAEEAAEEEEQELDC